jgi:hypothetical protein
VFLYDKNSYKGKLGLIFYKINTYEKPCISKNFMNQKSVYLQSFATIKARTKIHAQENPYLDRRLRRGL